MANKAYSSYKIVGVNHLEITINVASAEYSILRTAELNECGNLKKQETAVQKQRRTEHVVQSYYSKNPPPWTVWRQSVVSSCAICLRNT